MRTLYESIFDVDDNIDKLDIVEEFKKLKKEISKESNWKRYSSPDYISISFQMEAPFLCRYLGTSGKVIKISGSKFKYHSSFTIHLNVTDGVPRGTIHSLLQLNIPSKGARTSNGAIKASKEIFKSLDIFVDFINKAKTH